MSGNWFRNFVELFFDLDTELSIWVDEEELGRAKRVHHKNKHYLVEIPKNIHQKKTLRLKGLGKKIFFQRGDLYLQIWLNKGIDIRKSMWIPASTARKGGKKRLFTGEKMIVMVIPPNSTQGLTIRLKGCGAGPKLTTESPHAYKKRKRGNLWVDLEIFPDRITPKYGSFNALSTDNMAMEGWVYRKYDEILDKIGKDSLPEESIHATAMADFFNEGGLTKILNVLINHFNLSHINIHLFVSESLARPGECKITTEYNDNVRSTQYRITINEQFVTNPFMIAAILAHELSHVIYWEKLSNRSISFSQYGENENFTLDVERTVDLLVFMYKMGEFQLRIARDKRLSFGYFNQEIFERMQVIVSRKMGTL